MVHILKKYSMQTISLVISIFFSMFYKLSKYIYVIFLRLHNNNGLCTLPFKSLWSKNCFYLIKL